MNVEFALSFSFKRMHLEFFSDYSILQFIRESDEFEVNSDYSGFRFDINQYSFDVYIKYSAIHMGIYRDGVLISKHNDCKRFDISINDDRVKIHSDLYHVEFLYF